MLKAWVNKFWWFRGAVAATTLVALVPKFTEITTGKLLRAIHAFIAGWNTLAADIGSIIGRVPLIPHLSPETVNGIMFGISVSLPLSVWHVKKNWEERSGRNWEERTMRSVGPFLIWSAIGWFLYSLLTNIDQLLSLKFGTFGGWQLICGIYVCMACNNYSPYAPCLLMELGRLEA